MLCWCVDNLRLHMHHIVIQSQYAQLLAADYASLNKFKNWRACPLSITFAIRDSTFPKGCQLQCCMGQHWRQNDDLRKDHGAGYHRVWSEVGDTSCFWSHRASLSKTPCWTLGSSPCKSLAQSWVVMDMVLMDSRVGHTTGDILLLAPSQLCQLAALTAVSFIQIQLC